MTEYRMYCTDDVDATYCVYLVGVLLECRDYYTGIIWMKAGLVRTYIQVGILLPAGSGSSVRPSNQDHGDDTPRPPPPSGYLARLRTTRVESRELVGVQPAG